MFRSFVALLASAIILLAVGNIAIAQGILPEGAKWEQVATGGKGTAEGAVAARDGTIYIVDLAPPGQLLRYDPKTGQTIKVMDPSGMANGLHIDKNGDLLMGQGQPGVQVLSKRNLTTGAMTVLADKFEGKRLVAPNDMTTDDAGRIYFTDARYNQVDEPELPNSIYRLDPDGKLTRISMDLIRPNGIEVSPDGKRLYIANSIVGRLKSNPHGPATDKFGITKGGVVVYDLAADGTISNGRLFYKTDIAMADGMALDTDGNLYVALHDNPNRLIVALDPDGKVIQEFPLPETGLTVQLGFGRGEDASTLYLTTGAPWGLYRIKTSKKGFYRN
jgi:gluconolactonase